MPPHTAAARTDADYRELRHPSTAPSMSPRANTSSPAPSPADASDSEAPSFISEPSNTSTDQADTDSLIDASASEVEARALEFLHDDSAPHPLSSSSTLLHHSAQTAAEIAARIAALGPSIGLNDLPRKIPKSIEQQEEQQAFAVAFLRKCLDEAEDTDWMYRTPPAFAAPGALDPRGGDSATKDAGDGTAWLDDAFNLESYPAFEDEGAEEGHALDEGGGGLQFMDLGGESQFGGPSTGTPYLRDGEENSVGAGFGTGGRGRTGGLTRGVSEMAMD
ncbi:hypothetical protein P7C70_g6475, partial [Phenoliferia sp. Uapishka_3]